MRNYGRTFFIHIQFLIAVIFTLCSQSYTYAIRAGLDYTLEVTDGNESKIVGCDICNYASFADNNTYFQTRTVNVQSGYVEIVFLKKTDYNPTYSGPEINYNDITIFQDQEISIDYHKVVRVKKGQTVKLKGTNIKLKIIDVFGKGCPEGSVC